MTKQTRTQISWNGEDDPVLVELTQEADLRGISVAQHAYDLLRSRYLARRGVSVAELLGGMVGGPGAGSPSAPPTSTAAPQRTQLPPQETIEEPPEAARQVASAWASIAD